MPRFGARIPDGPLSVLVFGAHFDDFEVRFGGTATKYRELSHKVTLVCMTNGEAGHHEQGGATLGQADVRRLTQQPSTSGQSTLRSTIRRVSSDRRLTNETT